MTIREFVKAQKAMGINEWLKLIEDSGFCEFEKIILNCAHDYDLIVINHKACFGKMLINKI